MNATTTHANETGRELTWIIRHPQDGVLCADTHKPGPSRHALMTERMAREIVAGMKHFPTTRHVVAVELSSEDISEAGWKPFVTGFLS